jgi:hypothetical protein
VNFRPALALALVLALAGCKEASTAPAAAAPAAKPTQATLLASIPQRSSVPFHFAVSGDDEMTGVIDGRHDSAEFDMINKFPTDGSVAINVLQLGHKSWVKLAYVKPRPGHSLPKQWLTVDYDKARKSAGNLAFFGQENDPGLVTQVFVYAENLRSDGPDRISGTTDVSSMPFFSWDHSHALGSGERQVPFTAVLDREGRLSSVAVQVPAAGKFAAMTYKVSYTDYGIAKLQEPPAAGDQIPAPDGVYKLFAGAQYAGPEIS